MPESQISTLADLPFHFVGRFPRPTLVRRCTAQGFDNYSSNDLFDRIRTLSLGLAAIGVKPGDRVALMSDSRPEWVIADLAILTAGAVTVPIYPTLPAEPAGYILADSGAEIAIVADEVQAAKVRQVRPELPQLRELILIDGEDDAGLDGETTLAAVQERGHQRLMTEDGLARRYKEAAAAIDAEQLATIIYTSGTTGDAKGVMLTHGAIVANLIDVDSAVHFEETDEALSFLPLSHAFERTTVYMYLFKGVGVTFAESLETVARDMVQVRPTVMTGVPRVFEKLHARVHEMVAKAPAIRQRLFHWALGVGAARVRAARGGGRPPLLAGLADRLVLSKVRDRTGGRLRFVCSGGAPLPVHVAEFLLAVGIPVLEGYGLTETAPVLTTNPLDAARPGTVGLPLPRVELRIAEDGEILARGPNLMRGYYGKPEATAEAIRDGWFHTGDIGRFDDGGYLVITDRKKELLVTAGGKNIAPQPVEQRLKQHVLVAEAVLIGDRRPYVTALLMPDFAALAAALGEPPADDREALLGRSDVQGLYDPVVAAVNAGQPAYEQIKRYRLLPAELSIDGGELTPTLKVKRRVIAEKWGDLIDELYTP
ncbi:MAG: long-chain fatty acid--CoA ligase [Acidobacteria bacterium]|nr:long-chain fatty acid--CoA ligase [Acidobacteriota bacterium]